MRPAIASLLALGLNQPVPRIVVPPRYKVTVCWNRSTDPNVAGYNVYYGVGSRSYTNQLDAGNVTNIAIALPRTTGVTYFFAATAYNSLGIESVYSNEASFSVPTPKTNTVITVKVPYSTSLNGPWTNFLIIYNATNPPGSMFFLNHLTIERKVQ